MQPSLRTTHILQFLKIKTALSTKRNFKSYPCSLLQMASAVRSMISEPSSSTLSQIRSAVSLGRQVAKSVRNHCMVNTFVSGGS